MLTVAIIGNLSRRCTPGLLLHGFALCSLVCAQPPDRGITVDPTITDLPAAAKRWAIVIGVNQYDDKQITTLRGAAGDAESVAKGLIETSGFSEDHVVILTTNQPADHWPTRSNIFDKLELIKRKLAAEESKNSLLLVFFSGHGIERRGRAYLIPSDAKLSILEKTALSVEELKQEIDEIGMKQVILLLDACRSDPALSRGDAPSPLTKAYLFPFDVRNREVDAFATIYATSLGQRAFEYADRLNGYFTGTLVEGLRGGAANAQGEVTLGALVAYLQDRVPKLVATELGPDKKQRPHAEIQGYLADKLVIAKITQPPVPVIPKPPPDPLSPQLWKNPKDQQDYNYIPPGSFVMGCAASAMDRQCLQDEMPPHPVQITHGFWMGKTEVKELAYQNVVQAGGKHDFRNPGGKYGTRPVVNVTWKQSAGYCQNVGGRLPTEAEWEYAARGGIGGRIYPWGNTADPAAANYFDTKSGEPQPVASFAPNPWGLYDMAGNVYEWVSDYYSPAYPKDPKSAIDPQGPAAGTDRVKRGGSFYSPLKLLRVSARGHYSPKTRDSQTGFRCVIDNIPTP